MYSGSCRPTITRRQAPRPSPKQRCGKLPRHTRHIDAPHLTYSLPKLNRGRQFADGIANRKERKKAGDGLGSVETPHNDPTPCQPDPLESQSKHTPTVQALSSHAQTGPSSRRCNVQGGVHKVFDVGARSSLFRHCLPRAQRRRSSRHAPSSFTRGRRHPQHNRGSTLYA
jgi:hypothetical protein